MWYHLDHYIFTIIREVEGNVNSNPDDSEIRMECKFTDRKHLCNPVKEKEEKERGATYREAQSWEVPRERKRTWSRQKGNQEPQNSKRKLFKSTNLWSVVTEGCTKGDTLYLGKQDIRQIYGGFRPQ